ncbi:TrkH family potassium uptake protein [Kiloniella laminariae]|uniref:Trk system potassium uptake protein n=1 Tax=Kiloniella laminariae TaxID=454162 RepID=A0ABT4LM82_9PROT|nr:TrkH family potassium uptake protein [Kiloniella laminariae]MCZ4282235.1 TrkH family potassium uptake protein [Kiloniella laminariae]
MIQFRPVVFVTGILLSIMAIAMIIPAVVDAAAGHPDWRVFATSSALSLSIGIAMVLATNASWHRFSLREAFVITNVAWLTIAVAGAIPLAFSELELSVTDAFFESMSGITTTGSTIIVGLDSSPPGILLWRGILQWLGGIGIIVMAVAILPMLQVGGMQMFRVEAFEADKVLPKAAQIAAAISIFYVFITIAAAVILSLLGMSGFDAVVHAMTSIATGGFSNYDSSIAHFKNPMIHWAICLFMVLGSIPFILYLRVIRGDLTSLLQDSQVKTFLIILAVSVLTITLWLWYIDEMSLGTSLRLSAFNVISVMTGTGYSSADYGQWGGFALALMFILMFVGGCAGSTTCGIKIFRLQVLYATTQAQLNRLIQPNGIFFPNYNNNPIPESVSNSVMSFFFLFAVSFVFLAVGLGAFGLDFITAVSGAATAIANVGPGLGDVIGPVGNFKTLPDGAKWLMAAGMLLGRLELFTILVMVLPRFWRG